jgi:hypothetical protein
MKKKKKGKIVAFNFNALGMRRGAAHNQFCQNICNKPNLFPEPSQRY